MKCIKCNGKIIDGCCIKCGSLESGNIIENNEVDKNEDLRLFNKDFDIINLNKNLLLVFILGPLYFSYRGFLILGTILGVADYLLFYYFMNSISIIGNLYISFLCFFINRLIYIIFSNYICLLIDKFIVNRIKKKYRENYKDKLKTYKHNKYYLLITIIIYFILITMFVISKGIKNGLL